MASAPTLHMLCGLMELGKSTLAARLAKEDHAVLIAEDDWTAALWPGELTSLETYRDRSRRLRGTLFPHVAQVLGAGASVALDFAANTRGQRASMAALVAKIDVCHILHVLETPPELCRARVAARHAAGTHPYAPTPEDFDRFAAFFEPPTADEGFVLRFHSASASQHAP